MDNIKQWIKITISQCVRAAEDRSRWKEIVSQVMLANNQTCSVVTKKTRQCTHLLSPTTLLFDSAFLCHDKHVPCGAVQPTTNSRCRKQYVLLGGPSRLGGPGTCPIGPMVNPALIIIAIFICIPLLINNFAMIMSLCQDWLHNPALWWWVGKCSGCFYVRLLVNKFV